jgi:hypothetical protein
MKTKVDGNQGHADGQSKKKVAGLNWLHKPLDQPKTRDLQIHTKGKRSTDSFQSKKSTDTYQKQEIYSYIPKTRELHTTIKRSTATYQR